jgi:hypothetical protein
MVAAQPRVVLHHHQLGPALATGAAAVPAEGTGQLRHEGQRADAAPDLMADGTDQQQPANHPHLPLRQTTEELHL